MQVIIIFIDNETSKKKVVFSFFFKSTTLDIFLCRVLPLSRGTLKTCLKRTKRTPRCRAVICSSHTLCDHPQCYCA